MFAVGIVAGLVACGVLVGGLLGGKAIALAIVVALGVGRAFWQVIRHQGARPAGVLLREDQAPALFAHVRQLAEQVDTRPPDEIRLVADVNAGVQEDTGWLGLKPGTRRMYIGVPLLMSLTVDQMRAVLAHELGHYSHSHTRLGEITYKGRATIIRTAQNIGPKKLAGYLFRGYLWLYLLVSKAVSRQQELEADRAAVRAAGKAATASALQEIQVVDAAWDFYVQWYISGGYQHGYFPDRVFDGFAELLAARSGELAALRDEGPRGASSRWDSHPSVPERLAAIAREPEHPVPQDDRPASTLVPGFGVLVREVEAGAFDVGGRTVLPWEEFTAVAATKVYQDDVDVLYRAAARTAGLPRANLGVVLDLLAAGRVRDLVVAVSRVDWDDPEERKAGMEALAALIGHAAELAAVHSGVARWRHSWSAPVSLATPDGRPVEFGELVSAAVADPSAVPEVRAALARLGVDESQGAQVATRATADNADLIGAISDVKVDGVGHDLLVLDEGLVFVPVGKSAAATGGAKGEHRLHELLASADVARLAAQNRWLPYEDVATVALRRRIPSTYEIRLHDGSAVELKVTLGAEGIGKSEETLAKVLARFV